MDYGPKNDFDQCTFTALKQIVRVVSSSILLMHTNSSRALNKAEDFDFRGCFNAILGLCTSYFVGYDFLKILQILYETERHYSMIAIFPVQCGSSYFSRIVGAI